MPARKGDFRCANGTYVRAGIVASRPAVKVLIVSPLRLDENSSFPGPHEHLIVPLQPER